MPRILRAAAVVAVIAIAAVIGLRFAGLTPDVAGPVPSPSEAGTPSPVPTASPPAGCVNPPVDITTLIWISPLTGQELYDPVACYGDAMLTLDGLLSGGVADCPNVVEPVWLSCSGWSLRLVGETRKVGAPELFVAVHPDATDSAALYQGTNVRITGHFDDPAAQDCREVERSPAVGGTPEPAAVTIDRCRRTFVVLEVVPLEP